MQEISSMRRNSTYQNFIDSALFVSVLLIYDALSSMHLWLPPLFGILFLVFVNFYEKGRYYSLFAFVIVLCVMEANKGFCPALLFIIYCLMYMFLHNRIVKAFKYVNIVELIYIPAIYLALIILNSFFALNSQNLPSINFLLWYIFAEILMMVCVWILNIK